MAVCRYSPNVSTAAPCASVKTQTGPGVHPKNINGQQASSDFRLAILNAHRAECKVELLQEELQTMTERCAQLEYKNISLRLQFKQHSSPRQCILPHEITKQKRNMLKHFKKRIAQLEHNLEQTKVKRLVM
ncbi:hypothetical protein LPJ72_006315, partial [Coemansia sp. Benny D160-2]